MRKIGHYWSIPTHLDVKLNFFLFLLMFLLFFLLWFFKTKSLKLRLEKSSVNEPWSSLVLFLAAPWIGSNGGPKTLSSPWLITSSLTTILFAHQMSKSRLFTPWVSSMMASLRVALTTSNGTYLYELFNSNSWLSFRWMNVVIYCS